MPEVLLMGRPGPESRLVDKMRKAGQAAYGDRFVVIKYHGSAYTQAGVSDLLICLDGVFVAVEVKAPDNYGGSVERAVEQGPTVKQRAFIERVAQAGGVSGAVASVEGFMFLLGLAAIKAREQGF